MRLWKPRVDSVWLGSYCSSTVVTLVEFGDTQSAWKSPQWESFVWYRALLLQYSSAFCQWPTGWWFVSSARRTTELMLLFTGMDTRKEWGGSSQPSAEDKGGQ